MILEFDPPSGDRLRVTLDAHTAPTQLPHARRYVIAVLDGGQPAVAVSFRMWVLRGEVNDDVLANERMPIDDLLEAAREKGIRDLAKSTSPS